MILLLFPEKRLNLILGLVHESHAGPVQKQFSKVLPSYPNIIIVVSYGLLVIQFQYNGNQQKNTNWVESS